MNGSEWLEQATGKIVFGPDREAVRRELADHLRDRQERYAARGLTPEEAEAAALADMGDPADIAEELGRLHRPWWGYLWQLSRCVLGLSVFALVFALCLACDRHSSGNIQHLWDMCCGMEAISIQQLSGSAEVGAYTVSASTALMERAEDGRRFLCFSLRFRPHILWEPIELLHSYRAYQGVTLTDDRGRLYSLDDRGIREAAVHDSLPSRCLEFLVELEGDRLPQWLDIPLGTSGYTVRLDPEEGVTCR